MTNHCLLTLVFVVAALGVAAAGGQFGALCSDKHACENGGTCDPNGSVDDGTCSCPTGYSGLRCQTECSSSTDCLNGGTCVRTACMCPVGYTGGKCGTVAPPGAVSGDVCSSVHPCANGGTCSPSSSGGEGVCSCPTGYEGKRCQAACSTHEDCQNKGTCEARGCKCPAGYTGGKCETALSGAGHMIIFPAAVLMSVVMQLTLST